MGATLPMGQLSLSPGSVVFKSLHQLGNGPDGSQKLSEFFRTLSVSWSQRPLFSTHIEKT